MTATVKANEGYVNWTTVKDDLLFADDRRGVVPKRPAGRYGHTCEVINHVLCSERYQG